MKFLAHAFERSFHLTLPNGAAGLGGPSRGEEGEEEGRGEGEEEAAQVVPFFRPAHILGGMGSGSTPRSHDTLGNRKNP